MSKQGEPWEGVNESPDSVDDDFSACCVNSRISGSPIDVFHENIGEVLKFGIPDDLSWSPTLGRLLTLGLVTGTEAYFRSIFLGMISVCPLTRERVADQMVPLGALDYYGAEQIGMGLFEGISFAGEGRSKEAEQQSPELYLGRYRFPRFSSKKFRFRVPHLDTLACTPRAFSAGEMPEL